ncbi:hypothetical protein ACOME3_003714 [Neoechinorhynchus agilis]
MDSFLFIDIEIDLLLLFHNISSVSSDFFRSRIIYYSDLPLRPEEVRRDWTKYCERVIINQSLYYQIIFYRPGDYVHHHHLIFTISKDLLDMICSQVYSYIENQKH